MQTIKSFFDELAPRLDTARVLDQELDRNLARRFNVLDYLKTDELGLSRIIADLFNPDATHGQGVLFLRTFLANLKGLNRTTDWPELDRSRITVVPEQTITDQRKIDVVVEIKGPDGKTYCLAIENKVKKKTDRDRENQVKHYLEHLKGKKYGDRFLLIYLSPTGEGPSEWSIPKDELYKWKNHFAIMPYYRGHEEVADDLNDFRPSHSLAEWLGECRKNCDVERLRWFLRDAETFCQRTFGGQAMTTDSETKALEDFVLSDSHRLRTAGVVYESWPAIKNDVCKKFLERLRSAIEQKASKDFGEDLEVKVSYDNDGHKYGNGLWLYRNYWIKDEGKESTSDPFAYIYLQNDHKGPNGWYIGVVNAKPVNEMESEEKERRQFLEKELRAQLGHASISPYWPWGKWVEADQRNWDSLVPELHKECQDNGGEITSYFVNTFIEIAEKAIPIINEIETGNSKI